MGDNMLRVDDLVKLREYINLQLEKINDDISKIEIEEQNKQNNLEKLLSVITSLETDLETVDLNLLSNILSVFEVDSSIKNDLHKLEEVLKLNKFLINPQIPNMGVKKDILNFLDSFKKKLKGIYNSYSVKNFGKRHFNQINLLKLQKKYSQYLGLFNEERFTKTLPLDEINSFFDFLENSSIDKEVILNLITEYSKFSINYFNNHIDQYMDAISTEVNDKAIEIFEKLEGELTYENVQEVEQDISVSLTDEEQEIMAKINGLINKHRNKSTGIGFEIVSGLFSDLSLDDRIIYVEEDHLNWDLILADFDLNLFGNISTNKYEVFLIFKYIIAENEKMLQKQEQRELELSRKKQETEEGKEIYLNLRNKAFEILEESKELLYQFNEKYNIDVDKYYKLCYSMFSNEEYDQIKQMFPHIDAPIEEILLLFSVKELENYLHTFESVDFDMLDLSELIDDLSSYIAKYNDCKVVFDANSHTKDPGEFVFSKNTFDLDKVKNLILLLKDSNGSFIPLNDINNENMNGAKKNKEYELKKALSTFVTRDMSLRKKELKARLLTCTANNGEDITIKEKYGIDGERIRFSEYGRTGYILIPVCEENRKKLIDIYGNNIFQKFNSIIMIVGTIDCDASHNAYDGLTEDIANNLSYILNVLKVFNDPTIDVSILTNIIEESMNSCKEYVYEGEARS